MAHMQIHSQTPVPQQTRHRITWLTCRYTVRHQFLSRHAIVLTLISGLVFAGLTEICQDLFFQSRQGDVYDFAADSLSIILGTVIVSLAGPHAVRHLDRMVTRNKTA